jgi:2'-5' RNA ligase
LTLGRIREGSRLRAAQLFEGLADSTFGTTSVDAITLFHSKLSPKGSVYTRLKSTNLRSSV